MPTFSAESLAGDYKPFDGLLIALTVCKFFSLVSKIVFEQSSMDIFMIDWESPKMFQHATKRGTAVNPWRQLYITNELNEL